MYIAFVLLATVQPLVDSEVVIAAYRKLAPDGPPLRASKETEKGMMTLDLGKGAFGALALVEVPVPGGEAERAVEHSVAHLSGWRLPPHRAHIIVTMPHAPEKLGTREALTAFTRVVGAVAQAQRLGLEDLLFSAPLKGEHDALSTFFDLIAYTVTRGRVPTAGDTVGPSAKVRWKVKHVPSPIDKKLTVWSVDAR
jgi:hypothetical protein